MAFSDDLPPQITKDVVKRRSRKRRTIRSKDLELLIRVATRAAHIAGEKGFYIVSPEVIRCVEVLRMLRSLPLTPRLIIKTQALRALRILATNGNPKIRSESKSVLNHLDGILAWKTERKDFNIH